jgi:hypothetical protein
MRLDTFLLADAVASADGKVYIHGGSVTRLRVPVLPFPLGQLGVYARLLPEDDAELLEPHELLILIIGPTGLPNVPPAQFTIGAAAELEPLLEGEQRLMDLAINIGGVTIMREGLHRVELHLDGQLLGEAPLPAALMEPVGDDGTIAAPPEP